MNDMIARNDLLSRVGERLAEIFPRSKSFVVDSGDDSLTIDLLPEEGSGKEWKGFTVTLYPKRSDRGIWPAIISRPVARLLFHDQRKIPRAIRAIAQRARPSLSWTYQPSWRLGPTILGKRPINPRASEEALLQMTIQAVRESERMIQRFSALLRR